MPDPIVIARLSQNEKYDTEPVPAARRNATIEKIANTEGTLASIRKTDPNGNYVSLLFDVTKSQTLTATAENQTEFLPTKFDITDIAISFIKVRNADQSLITGWTRSLDKIILPAGVASGIKIIVEARIPVDKIELDENMFDNSQDADVIFTMVGNQLRAMLNWDGSFSNPIPVGDNYVATQKFVMDAIAAAIGSGGAFNPMAIPGFIAYFEGGQGQTLSGGALASWKSQGNNNTLTFADGHRPAINQTGGITLLGSHVGKLISDMGTSPNQLHFIVIKINSGVSSNQRIFTHLTENLTEYTICYSDNSSSQLKIAAVAGGGFVDNIGVPGTFDQFVLMKLKVATGKTGNDISITVNGVIGQGTVDAPEQPLGNNSFLLLGSANEAGDAESMQGEIQDFMIYSGNLSAMNELQIESYLKDKHNIPY